MEMTMLNISRQDRKTNEWIRQQTMVTGDIELNIEVEIGCAYSQTKKMLMDKGSNSVQ